ncbi:probable RNA-directed DNA polymerase from transposon X-element [Trichonephila clavipes]|nr:probable RNA-directed DNA polymerase from transposon X-element [Trichonephila clavipes]
MPTRYGTHSSNTLDIALINNFNFPYDITSISDLSSDHNPVILNFSLCNITHMDKTRAISTCWSTFHKNLDKNIHFADMLNINNPHTLEDKIKQFTDAVRSAHSQASKPITRKTHSYTPQIIKDLITLKNRARKLYHNTLNPIYRTEANRLQAHIKKQFKIHTQVWTDRLKALNTQDNSIWQIQKNFRRSKSSIPTLTHTSGIATSDDQKANALANSFKSNYTENKRPDNCTNNIDSDVTLTLENFFANPPTTPLVPTNTDEVINSIKNLKNNKAPGLDNINKMIKNFSFKTIFILTHLINKILKLRHFPCNWKTAIVFPIHKLGKSKKSPDSYRPISLLSSLSKIAEHIILIRINQFISNNNFLNPNQYGFTKQLSTYHPLLRLTEQISAGFQRGRSTGAVFLDIQKAFDRVWISGLIYKLITNNFPAPLIHIINSYLVNRTYKVRVNNTLSLPHRVNIGVTQGSLLGPVLFNIYLNDIPSHPQTMLNLQPRGYSQYATDQSQCLLSPASSQQTSTGFPLQTFTSSPPPPTPCHLVIFYVTQPANQVASCFPSWYYHFTRQHSLFMLWDGGTLRVPCPNKSYTVILS